MINRNDDRQSSISWLSGSLDSPELQKDKSTERGYSIPTRIACKATGELEDIHIALADISDDKKRENLMQALKKVDGMTIAELSKMLNYARIGLTLKEVEGEELTEPEKTIKDIDIATLALFIVGITARLTEKGEPHTKGSE